MTPPLVVDLTDSTLSLQFCYFGSSYLIFQATVIEFMNLYGNPALSMDEAGYYLTTLSVAGQLY